MGFKQEIIITPSCSSIIIIILLVFLIIDDIDGDSESATAVTRQGGGRGSIIRAALLGDRHGQDLHNNDENHHESSREDQKPNANQTTVVVGRLSLLELSSRVHQQNMSWMELLPTPSPKVKLRSRGSFLGNWDWTAFGYAVGTFILLFCCCPCLVGCCCMGRGGEGQESLQRARPCNEEIGLGEQQQQGQGCDEMSPHFALLPLPQGNEQNGQNNGQKYVLLVIPRTNQRNELQNSV